MDLRRRAFFRWITVVTVGLFCVTIAVGPFAETAWADAPAVSGAPVSPPQTPESAPGANANKVVAAVYDNIWTIITRAGMVAFFNAAQTFAGRIAYDAANYIAAGGKGQAALFYKQGVGDYLSSVGQDAGGAFIESLSNDKFFKSKGINLCKPAIPDLLKIQLSLGNFFPGLQPNLAGVYNPASAAARGCSFKDITNNWSNVADTMTSAQAYDAIGKTFDTNSSDLGAAVQIANVKVLQETKKVDSAEKQREEGKGFKSVDSLVSGNIKTPGAVVNEQANQAIKDAKGDTQAATWSIFSNGMSQGAVQLAAYTASIFINTLASKMLKRVFEKGLDAFDYSDAITQQAASNPDAIVTTGKIDVRNANIDLKATNFPQVADVNLVAEMIGCPAGQRGLWNCTMDQDLARAVQTEGEQGGGVTVQEALDNSMLHTDWQLIPETMVKENQDANCYTHEYCAGNLQKMRLARILPVGFEMAANAKENKDLCANGKGCIKLGTVVKGFYECPASGLRDADHPWCHLIDPTWVITSLPQQCVLKGYGDTLLDASLNQRQQECSDVQTCLLRDNNGRCVGGYGYCLAEKTAYRFQAQACNEQFASCRMYQSRAGQGVGYLRNTLDYAQCGPSNVGCLWYSTQRIPALTTSSTNWWAGDLDNGPRMYFDKDLKPCSASDEGCTTLVAINPGDSSLNLLLNPSFERSTTTAKGDLSLQNWTLTDTKQSPAPFTEQLPSARGVTAYEIKDPASALQQFALVNPLRMYTISTYLRAERTPPGPPTLHLNVQQYHGDSSDPKNVIVAGTEKDFRSEGCARLGDADIHLYENAENISTDWQRFECAFLSNASASSVQVTVIGGGIFVDALQLEEGEFATDFVDGINPALAVTSMKVAPEEFGCTGSDTDHELCAKYARACSQADVGCQGYTDTSGENPQEIPAIASTDDKCPAACVGYAEFHKEASAFDLIHEADARFDDAQDQARDFFIQSTAKQCTAADVGCQEFTNVEGANAGGESRAYFSYVRACQKPSDQSKTFFTWEGSDTSGYQLRTWSLIADTHAKPLADAPPSLILKRAADQKTFKEPGDCRADTWNKGASPDPDCRQFYDAGGNVFYAFYSQTILSSDECKDFRLNKTNIDDCQKTGGSFNPNTAECAYHVYQPESHLCQPAAVACRAYDGAGAGNVQTVLHEDFKNNRGKFTSGVPSAESVLVGGRSLKLGDQNAPKPPVETTVAIDSKETEWFTVSFWVKDPTGDGTQTLDVSAATVTDPNNGSPIGTVHLTANWQRFQLGPFNGHKGAVQTSIVWKSNVPLLYLTEITINKVQQSAFVIADSWKTPNICDQSPSGAPEPQAMLNCREYRDRNGQSVDLRQFTRLCRETAISCRAFIDTRNNTSLETQTFVRADNPPLGWPTATTTRLAPTFRYLIDEPRAHCQPENASCRAFGKPKFLQDRSGLDPIKPTATTTQFTTVYFKDDITAYAAALCKPSEIFCEEFNAGGGKEYFRDPQTHACAYKTNVHLDKGAVKLSNGSDVAEGVYSGWFRHGIEVPCYPDQLQNGDTFGLAHNGDQGSYAGWGGLCGTEVAECTEFRDVNDTSDPLHKTGKPYFFINNSSLTDPSASCDGQVDVSKGCILLRDMGSSALKFNVQVTYDQYAKKYFKPIAPVDCQNPSNADACAVKRYTGSVTVERFKPDPNDAKKTISVGSVVTNPRWLGPECGREAIGTVYVPQIETVGLGAPDPVDGATQVQNTYKATCQNGTRDNDANLLVKVNVDRDCSQWLGCKSSETVLDPTTQKYKDICTDMAICDKASGEPGDLFCAHYVDRSSTSTDPILAQGNFFDINLYASREVGLGKRDYSGYSMPDAFQVADLQNQKVAADGAGTVGNNKSKYVLDYRLVAAVPITGTTTNRALDPKNLKDGEYNQTPPPKANEARILDTRTSEGKRYDHVYNLCQHVGTGIIGYYNPNDLTDAITAGANRTKTFFCYLPVSVPQKDASPDPAYNFDTLADKFSLLDPKADAFLTQAFPPAVCRANPETDSPFPITYVQKDGWDLTKNPPKSVNKVQGYENANVCEYGEDCECSYKRAEYSGGAPAKFYGLYSGAVPPGVCQGGPRDGQGCLPETIFKLPQTTTDPNTKQQILAAEGSNASQTCGPPEGGGRCVAFSRLQIVRGVFGDCLERDTTRNVAGNLSSHPCLTWNPTPILFGEKDPYHFVPSAGYMPPQNSGQYYCLSQAHTPSQQRLQESDFIGACPDVDNGTLGTSRNGGCKDKDKDDPAPFAGQMYKLGFFDEFIGDAHFGGKVDAAHAIMTGGASLLFGSSNSGDRPGAFIVDPPHRPGESQTGDQCGDAYHNEGNGTDNLALRIIGTGSDRRSSYVETFFRLKQPIKELNANGSSIAYVSVSPIRNANDKGRLGCGYQADWVDGLDAVNYSDGDDLATKDRQWQQTFFQNYQSSLTRGSETVLRQPEKSELAQAVNCSMDANKKCFVKYWQNGYRDGGEKSFLAFTSEGKALGISPKSFEDIRLTPASQTCEADKPYFSIRAVFEHPIDDQKDADITKADSVPGAPWVLTGFWTTSCAGKIDDARFLYMNVQVNHGDVCKELAEVQSKDSHQDAAFTDRVWKNAAYTDPGVGLQYGARYAPFSSVLNVGPAGTAPLFQTGNAVAGYSPLHPPALIAPGIDTYYRNDGSGYPKNMWAYLSNIFARVYRVYRYSDRSVKVGSLMCTGGGSSDGRLCGQAGHSAACDVTTQCIQNPVKKFCYLSEKGVGNGGYKSLPKDPPSFNEQAMFLQSCNTDADCVGAQNAENDNRGLKCFSTAKSGLTCPGQSPINPFQNTYKWLDPNLFPAKVTLNGQEYDARALYLEEALECDPVIGCGIDAAQSARQTCAVAPRDIPVGYSPDPAYCPDPGDEYCGLFAYNITDNKNPKGSLSSDPPSPTDVTLGHYTPVYLGFVDDINKYKSLSYYTPRPPRIAAPDARHCPSPGTCPIQREDNFSLDGQSEGVVNAGGGQHKATVRFYAWAAHNQMPLRSLTVDWGDGSKQNLPDARLKNHKPFCGTTKECSNTIKGGGITCEVDSDCPPGAGTCVDWGTCDKQQNIFCSTNADCQNQSNPKDTCTIRTLFGNSPEACEQSYFEFAHEYACPNKGNLPDCNAGQCVTGRAACTTNNDCNGKGGDVCLKAGACSRDPNRACNTSVDCAAGDECIANALAPTTGGCFDAQTNSCRFTPRVLIEDNWGWCTGECRGVASGGGLDDVQGAFVLHPYGGCYAWSTLGQKKSNIKFNTSPGAKTNDVVALECDPSFPKGNPNLRPWIVYPGSLELRSSGEIEK